MKKVLLVFAVSLVVVAGAWAQAPAVVTDSATLNLQGVIGPFVDITVWAAPAATQLALQVAVSPASPITVGSATITSNTAYTVDVASANGFEFSNGTNGVPYALHWNGGSAVSTAGVLETAPAGVANASRSIGVSYGAPPMATPNGTYTDSLTFTISSN